MSRFSRFVAFAAAVVVAASCSRTASVKGVVADAPSSDIVVKQLNVNQYQVLDTVKTDASGKFSLKVDVAKGQPEFVYLFRGDRKIASLLLEAGDKVNVQTDTLGACIVEGSEESLKLAAIEADYAAAKSEMIAISEKMMSADASEAGVLREQLSKSYIDYYRSRVRYVMQNSRSLTIVPVLFQNLSETLPVFGQATDAIFFKNAADTLETVYPESKYVKALRADASRRMTQMELLSKIAAAPEVNFLDIELPAVNGQKVKLSDAHKKLTLVFFWSAEDVAQKMFNLDVLAPVYEAYKDKGFEIYQVSLDVDNGLWARVMREQNLPWTNVSDISGGASRYVSAYNLSKIPAAFIIGGDGLTNAPITNAASLRKILEKELK